MTYNRYYKTASNIQFSMELAEKTEPALYSLQNSGIVLSLTVAEQNHGKRGRKKLEELLFTYIFFLVLGLAFQSKCDTVLL